MKFTIISGSPRKNSNSLKIAKITQSYLEKKIPGSEFFLLNMEEEPLPLWNDSVWDKDSALAKKWQPISQELKESQGLIVVCPEWHGMAPSSVKNFFLYCDNEVLAHKPGMIVSISSGIGGSYPITELRTSSYKNTRLCYIPDHMIIRKVEDFIEGYDSAESDILKRTKNHFHYCLDTLNQYALALNSVRDSGVINLKEFANGL